VRGTLFDPAFGGLSGRYPTGQGIIPFEARGALKSGLAYLSRCNSGWFCHNHHQLRRPQMTRRARSLLLLSLPRLMHHWLLLPRRRSFLPRTHHHCRLHFPAPCQGGIGGLLRRSGIHHPLTRLGNPTPLHPSAEERKPHRQLWGQTPGSSLELFQSQWR
jgi:hypothetical protein